MDAILDRLKTEAQLAKNGNLPILERSFDLAIAEIERLQEAKRRALAIADERSKENVALRAALKPFADIADLVNHTDRRDGERVYELPRKPGGAGYFTLVREDFRRAARAYGPVDLRITQPKPLAVEQCARAKEGAK